jgi:Flp pilus assembly pilin Flp
MEQEAEGQGLVEYAMILMLVALACVASLLALSDAIKTEFWDVITNVLIPALGA